MASVDRDLANHNADLAAKVQLVPDLDVRLALIEGDRDEYHVLQGLKDTTAGSDPNCYYCYQRSGCTGSRGRIEVDGPMLQPNVAAAIGKVFQEKTGVAWSELKQGDRGLPGKYYVQQQANPDLTAKWQYFVDNGVDGKSVGWYDYDPAATGEMEELYAQHVANGCESRTCNRVVSSGYFTYDVNLANMMQKNKKTGTMRTIRRSIGNEENSMQAPTRHVSTAMKKRSAASVSTKTASVPMRKAMKRTPINSPMKSTMKVAMKAMKAMKVMKAMKKKSNRGKKWQVLKGIKLKTKGGMKASDLMKNKNGKVVSKKQHAIGKTAYERNLKAWVTACTKAKSELGKKGFVAIKKGSDVYIKAKELMSAP